MDIVLQSFVGGDAGKCGAIMHRFGPGRVSTRTVFRMGNDSAVYLVDVSLDTTRATHDWTRFTRRSSDSAHTTSGVRTAAGEIEVNGKVIDSIRNAVPSYAEHLLVAELLAGGDQALSFTQFDENDPADCNDAKLAREGTETVLLHDGSLIEAERVELAVGGRRTNTHWGRAGVIVKSDWCGAESYWSADVAALLDGLDDTIAMHIREFLDDHNTLD